MFVLNSDVIIIIVNSHSQTFLFTFLAEI